MVTCAGFVEPGNLQCLFVNLFAGNATIFIFISYIFLAGIAARFQMRDEVVLLLMGVFTFIIAPFERGFVVLFMFIVALLAYGALKRVISR